jgi:hypothetical protein
MRRTDPGNRDMTAQIAERLRYDGEEVAMCTNPLSDYFAMGGVAPPFDCTSTALWRGYVGEWEILDGRLYLIGLRGLLQDGSEASLATVFPDFPTRVFAHWYSGTIRLPQGKQLEYIHAGYSSRYERDVLVDVMRGVVVQTRVRHNGVATWENAPEGYGVGAMTLFPRSGENTERAP